MRALLWEGGSWGCAPFPLRQGCAAGCDVFHVRVYGHVGLSGMGASLVLDFPSLAEGGRRKKRKKVERHA